MMPIPPAPLPPVTAEYANTFQHVAVQGPPVESAYRFSRAADGKTRVDSGNISVISNPAAAQTILLDHVKKTATMKPAPPPSPPGAAMPPIPHLAMPAMPGLPHPPADVKVEDLGKRILQGHEVVGQKFIMQPPALPVPAFSAPGIPKPPQVSGMPAAPAFSAPGMPKASQIPGMASAPKLPHIPGMPTPAFSAPGMPKPPQPPGMPPVPAAPQPPSVTEVWKSTSTGLPMLTKMTGSFGQLTQVCHSAVPGEPHPSTFQIPPGYKITGA